jgi:hypothetical protein
MEERDIGVAAMTVVLVAAGVILVTVIMTGSAICCRWSRRRSDARGRSS